jgi:exonuclease SbcC
MRLRRVEYRNWCQLVDLTVEFADGLNGLLGPNGSGKTNMLNGIVWCLTGVDRNAGVKADNINLHAGQTAKAGVRVFFEHEGAEVEVHRNLRHGQSMRVNKEKPVAGDKAVRALMRKVLGVPERVLLDYVFVAQRHIFDFLEADKDEAAATLAQLFGTERAELLYRLLGEARVPVPPPLAEADAVAARLERLRRDLTDAEATLKELAHLPHPWVEAQSPEHVACDSLRQRRELRKELADCEDRAALFAAEARRWAEAKEALELRHEAAFALVPRYVAAVESARQDLQAWELHRRLAEVAAQQHQERARLVQKWDELTAAAPEEPEGYLPDTPEERKCLDELVRESEGLFQWLGSWENTGKAACEACGTPVATIAERVPSARARLNELAPLIADAQLRWQQSEHYRTALRIHQGHLATVDAKLSALQSLNTDVPLPPSQSEEALHAQIHAAQEAEVERSRLARELHVAEVEWRSAQGSLEQWHQAAVATRAELHALPDGGDSDADYDKATAALAVAREAVRRRDDALLRSTFLQKVVAEDNDLLTQAHAARARHARAEQLRAHLEELREVFHRDGLAREVAEGYVATIRDGAEGQPGINDLLATFDAPFRAADFVDWRYRVRLASGKEHSALRLSDGQKVVLALAFRVVVNSLFARELGLLCLDEPTAGLDEDNRACLDVALGRLRELSKSRGLQVILVTHDRDTSLFDRYYRLAAAR